MDPSVQDWQTVVMRKATTSTTRKKSQQSHNPSQTSNSSILKSPHVEENADIVKLKTVSHDMAQFIIKTRVEKGLKQAELAKQANVDAKTMAEIERGGCVYNAGQVNKIAKALGVNIPRK